ncbi:DUF6504 family protein [Methylobacterium indicum]|uniref:DUF6504 family protein n=1 Tax=Methylobacterium indicum TaxID=1775910 RepID=UPI0024359FD5|nr:DUF6504 family protein [Methylobacterium indicum]
MRRVVCVFLPSWPTDRWRRRHGGPPPDEPVVAAGQDGPRRVLTAVDRAARAAGLRPGLALAQAQAMVPGLAVIAADPEEDAAALTRLAAWCLIYAPLVAPDPPDGIWIDVAGAAHLQGGEAALLGSLRRRLARAGYRVRVALADTPGAAWAAARCLHPETVLPPAGQRPHLLDLPLWALRLAPDTVSGLAQLGLTRVAHLLDQPRGPLRLRFGEAPGRRLDQALGHVPEPLAYLAPPAEHAVRLAFPEPIGAPETLAQVAGRLCAMLAEALARHGLGARRLDLVFRRVDGLDQAVSVGTARPSRDPAHLARLLTERLPQVDPGHGLDEARLSAPRVERLDARQLAAPGEEPDSDAMAELVDRLVLRLGPGRVFRRSPVESEWPERAVRRVAPLSPATGVTWPADLPRPGRLLPVPEPVAVLAALPDAPPTAFTWRGTRRRVARADGPERIFGEWWLAEDEVAATRDYYRVEDETGARYWLFRDALTRDGARWWLHGLGEA